MQHNENGQPSEHNHSLSSKEALILQVLIEGGRELFGLEMVDSSAGRLKRGTIYVTLQRMQEKGLVESRKEPRPDGEVGIARRLYRVTAYGQRVFDARQAALLIMFPLLNGARV